MAARRLVPGRCWGGRLGHEIRPSLDRLRGRAAVAVADGRPHVAHGRRHAALHDVGDPALPRVANRIRSRVSWRSAAVERRFGTASRAWRPRAEGGVMTTVRSSSAYVPVEAVPADRAGLSVRVADYLELAKPRIAAMVLLTVTVGFTLGSGGTWTFASLASALVGIGLVAAASGAFNQLIERHTDALMARTANRPLPTGRLQPVEVVAFGLVCCHGRPEPVDRGSQLDDGLPGVLDARPVCRRLYAAQEVHGPEHGRRSHSRCVAPRAGLDRLGSAPRLGGVFAVCRPVPLAVSAFSGDRLALPGRLRAAGLGCCRAERRGGD